MRGSATHRIQCDTKKYRLTLAFIPRYVGAMRSVMEVVVCIVSCVLVLDAQALEGDTVPLKVSWYLSSCQVS